MKNSVILVILLFLTTTNPLPVTVPVGYNNNYNSLYSQNSYDQSGIERKPNSFFNRLTNNLPQDEINNQNQNNQNNDYEDYDDQQTDKPVLNQHLQSSPQDNGGSSYNNFNNLYNYWIGNQRVKHRYKRRKGSQPCIPIALSNNNRYKRDVSPYPQDGKTLSLVLGDYNVNGGGGYYSGSPFPFGSGSPSFPSYDNTNPQNDRPGGYGSQSLVYQPYGGKF